MDEIAAFVRTQPVEKFGKESILMYQGEVPRGFYVIRSGFVKIFDLSSDGSEQVVGLSGAFDFIPTELLFSKEPVAQFFYAAFTPVEVYVVDREKLLDRINRNAEALYEIAQKISQQYGGLRRHLTAVQKPRAREKIVYVLHFLSSYFVAPDEQHARRVALPLTQQDIANMVGVTRETAAVELKRLKNEGHIVYDKAQLFIHESLQSLIA